MLDIIKFLEDRGLSFAAWDKTFHLAGCALLYMLFYHLTGWRSWIIAGTVFGIGLVKEALWCIVFNRTFDWYDIAFNTGGIIFGVLLTGWH